MPHLYFVAVLFTVTNSGEQIFMFFFGNAFMNMLAQSTFMVLEKKALNCTWFEDLI